MLLYSIDNQCVTKQLSYCVAKVEKQNNFLCLKPKSVIRSLTYFVLLSSRLAVFVTQA